jgi:hypothetical protein
LEVFVCSACPKRYENQFDLDGTEEGGLTFSALFISAESRHAGAGKEEDSRMALTGGLWRKTVVGSLRFSPRRERRKA